jgi:hypothetical protein
MEILRNENGPGGSRVLTAEINSKGDLVFEGRDYGKGVADIFGYDEYEWVQTIKNEHLPKLREALGNTAELMSMIVEKFGGDGSSNITSFMTENEIPIEFWSRMGD